jgi:RimJ/RimL family protein N-acetyltransferase
MFLVLTNPHSGDYSEFFELTQDERIQSEFKNFQNFDANDVIEHINQWIEINNSESLNWLKLIKIGFEDAEIYDSTNSKLIGFMSISDAGIVDQAITGCNNLFNFGIMEEFRNQGLMTNAVRMRLQRLKEMNYNLLYALVKSDNHASERVLEKAGFQILDEVATGKLYMIRF